MDSNKITKNQNPDQKGSRLCWSCYLKNNINRNTNHKNNNNSNNHKNNNILKTLTLRIPWSNRILL
jgi:hypothetical protein